MAGAGRQEPLPWEWQEPRRRGTAGAWSQEQTQTLVPACSAGARLGATLFDPGSCLVTVTVSLSRADSQNIPEGARLSVLGWR